MRLRPADHAAVQPLIPENAANENMQFLIVYLNWSSNTRAFLSHRDGETVDRGRVKRKLCASACNWKGSERIESRMIEIKLRLLSIL